MRVWYVSIARENTIQSWRRHGHLDRALVPAITTGRSVDLKSMDFTCAKTDWDRKLRTDGGLLSSRGAVPFEELFLL